MWRVDVGPAFQAALKTLEELPLVVETRGIGLMAGIELVDHTGGDPDADMEVSHYNRKSYTIAIQFVQAVFSMC